MGGSQSRVKDCLQQSKTSEIQTFSFGFWHSTVCSSDFGIQLYQTIYLLTAVSTSMVITEFFSGKVFGAQLTRDPVRMDGKSIKEFKNYKDLSNLYWNDEIWTVRISERLLAFSFQHCIGPNCLKPERNRLDWYSIYICIYIYIYGAIFINDI